MIKFIKRIFIFLCLVVSVATLIQILISLKIRNRSIIGHDNLDQTANINAELVLLGSSRCWVNLDPNFFNTFYHVKAVNIGVDGHSELSMAVIRLKNYLSKNNRPKFAILNFDPFVTAGSETDNKNFVHKDYFARYAFMSSKKNKPIVNYFKFNAAEKWIPLYALFQYRQLGSCLFPQNNMAYFKYGFDLHREQWDTLSKPVTDSAKKNFATQAETGSIKTALNKIKKICDSNGIRLLCIQTPAYKIIYDQEAFSEPAELCRELDIPFVDMNIPEIRNNIQYFYNSNHLNIDGVKRMNELLKKDITMNNFLKDAVLNKNNN